jgi:hypothetical protein
MHLHFFTARPRSPAKARINGQGLFGKGSYFVDRLGEGLSSRGMRRVRKKDPCALS